MNLGFLLSVATALTDQMQDMQPREESKPVEICGRPVVCRH